MAFNPLAIEAIAKSLGVIVWPTLLERSADEHAETFLNGGWRGSKTWGTCLKVIARVILRWLETDADRLIWLVGPDYEQARPEYMILVAWLQRLALKSPQDPSMAQSGPLLAQFYLPGGGVLSLATKSAENPTTLGSVGPDMIVACEAGQISEEGRDRIRGRSTTKNSPIIWAGTFENDKGKAQYAWFEEESAEYKLRPTPRRVAYSLPIYENIALFGNCLEGDNSILADPTLAVFCPDDNHGPAHSGIDPDHPDRIPGTKGVPRHPKVREQYEECRVNPMHWRKYYEGEPVGVQNPVYGWANEAPETFLVPMPKYMKEPNYRWLTTAGGMDFGTVHPSAITIGSITMDRSTWVRRSLKDSSGAMDWIWATKKVLTREYNVSAWGADPMVKYNPTFLEVEAMSGSLFSREARVGIVNGVAYKHKLYFDADDPGVVLLFKELQRVHRRKNAQGQVAYVREEDDMTASFEDMMAMLHGQPILNVSNRYRIPRRKTVRQFAPARSAS